MIDLSVYAPPVVINGYEINQYQNCIQIIVPNDLYATEEDFIKILTLTISLFERVSEDD